MRHPCFRPQEHSQAFNSKVSKRDAPDYADIVKNPMDLGTMQRNVRAGKYRTKAAFARDLELIWSNCELYNSPVSFGCWAKSSARGDALA